MQCSMPNSTAYQYACSTKRRSVRRAKPPLHGAQGHAVQHAQQHGVPVRVLYKAALRAPRKAAPTRAAGACSAACPTARCTSTRALQSGAPCAAQSRPNTGRRGMQCSMPNSTAYQYACSTKRRSVRHAKPPLHGAQGHAVRHAQQHGVPIRVLSKAALRAPRKAALTRGAGACSTACLAARRTRYACLMRRRSARRQ